jgi:hypothetical protein
MQLLTTGNRDSGSQVANSKGTKMKRRMKKGVLIPLVALIAMVGATLTTAEPASASVSCSPAHCYSWARWNGSIAGMWGQWHRNYMNAGGSSTGQFINSEMWMGFDGGGWIEMGLKNGYTANGVAGTVDGSCGCMAYSWFWADTQVGGPYNGIGFWRHILGNTSPTGNNNTYQISRAGTVNQWNVYLDGVPRGLSTATQRWTGIWQQIGGESSNANSNTARADNFDMYAKYINSSGVPTNWGGPNQTNITPGAGMEGVSYSGSEWSWQQHAS